MIVLLFLLAFCWPYDATVNAQYPGCDYEQQMQIGKPYYVYSPNYPNKYGPRTSCRWRAKSPVNSKIYLQCDVIEIPPSQNCDGDRLLVSTTGRIDLVDAQRYCGRGTLSLTSVQNEMNIVLLAMPYTNGGRFLCSITAVQTSLPTPPTPPPTCDCGWKKSTRIVGGVPTGVNEYPMMAGLVDVVNKIVYCGGTIISERYVVTAAHCVVNRDTSSFLILVGDDDLLQGNETPASRSLRVDLVRLHERFDTVTYQNDIAIVRTAEAIQYSQRVGPACLPFKYQYSNFAGASVTALGWGTTGFGEAPSNKLMKVRLTIQTNENCARYYPEDIIIPQQVCTYGDRKDTCQNDSGGPLCFEDTSSARVFLTGIISFGKNCGTTTPGVNTRVTGYLAWIQNNTPGAVFCVK